MSQLQAAYTPLKRIQKYLSLEERDDLLLRSDENEPRGYQNAKISTYLPFAFSGPLGTPPSLSDSLRIAQYGNYQIIFLLNEYRNRHYCTTSVCVTIQHFPRSCSTNFD
jgi:hypothetical protein